MAFARSIVKNTGAAFFVQDGFGVVHRSHASTTAIPLYLPSFAGLLVEKEYQTITRAMNQPARPLVAIVGGAKVSDKIGLIRQLIDRADKILIGGAMANTFLKFKGYSIGQSVHEDDLNDQLRQIYDAAAAKVGPENVDDFLVLPSDVAVGKNTKDQGQKRREVLISNIGPEDMALDIGSQTIDNFANIIKTAGTVIWNGPLGFTTIKTFSFGSARVALAIASNPGAISIVGGGETTNFVLDWDGQGGANFTHISTGGGASLALMSGEKLPGVESLLDAYGPGVIN